MISGALVSPNILIFMFNMGCFVSKSKYHAVKDELGFLQENQVIMDRKSAELKRLKAQAIRDRNDLFDCCKDNATLRTMLFEVSMNLTQVGRDSDASVTLRTVPLRSGSVFKASLV